MNESIKIAKLRGEVIVAGNKEWIYWKRGVAVTAEAVATLASLDGLVAADIVADGEWTTVEKVKTQAALDAAQAVYDVDYTAYSTSSGIIARSNTWDAAKISLKALDLAKKADTAVAGVIARIDPAKATALAGVQALRA